MKVEIEPGVIVDVPDDHFERECYICTVDLPLSCEMDHFPVPRCAGGTTTWRVCKACHDLKDRAPFIDVSRLMVDGIKDLRGHKDGDQRLLYLLFGNLPDVTNWVLGIWPGLDRAGRIFAARTLRVRYMNEGQP